MLHQPIKVGTASSNACHANDLGKLVVVDGKIYVVAKNTSAIADAAGRGVVTAFTSGLPTWNVSLPTDVTGYGFGIIPSTQVGSDGSTTLAAGDYFLLQIAGPATGLAGTTLIKTTAELHPGIAIQSLGLIMVYLNSSVGTVTVVRLNNTGYITNTAAAAVSGSQTCFLSGLI